MRITERQLRKIIRESVASMLNEGQFQSYKDLPDGDKLKDGKWRNDPRAVDVRPLVTLGGATLNALLKYAENNDIVVPYHLQKGGIFRLEAYPDHAPNRDGVEMVKFYADSAYGARQHLGDLPFDIVSQLF